MVLNAQKKTALNSSLKSSSIDLTSANTWAIFSNIKASEITASDITGVTVNSVPAVIGGNVKVKRYYDGTAIIPIIPGFSPITVYSGAGQTGSSATAAIHTIYTTSSVPLGNDVVSSFTLHKGHMATFAQNEDGTGRSKVYIAAENNLSIDLPTGLVGDVSFLRVMEWSYVNKKGSDHHVQAELDALNTNWFYHWTYNDVSRTDQEFLPMTWGKGAALNKMNDIIALENVTHLLGINEPDDCNAQSGQYGDLCIIDTAVVAYKNLLKSGLRLGTPSGREGAAQNSTKWTSKFLEKAQAQNIRIDFVAIHWYDWGGWFQNGNPNQSAETIFNKFKNYLTNAHNMYNLPIVITEFNANPNRTGAVNKAFMELAMPWLEATEWIERYCWFEPNSGVSEMFDGTGGLTPTGITWRDQVSTPSIPEATLECPNLQDISLSYVALSNEEITTTHNTGFSIYPNPAKNKFTINITGKANAKVVIYDTQGQTVYSSTITSPKYSVVNNDLKTGMYLVKVIDSENKIYTKKIILK